MGPDEERALLLACQRSDADAFARLVGRYQDLALRNAFLLTGERGAAEDVAQNTFLQVFRHLHRFDPARPFRPWLLGILANEAKMHRRRRRWPPWRGVEERPTEDADPTLDRFIRDDERARVRAALAALPEPLRTTAVLYYFNDLPLDQIAGATGCRVGTVKSRLHAARRQLRAALAPAPEPEPSDARPGALAQPEQVC